MWPDRVSNPGPLTYESVALPTALCGSAQVTSVYYNKMTFDDNGLFSKSTSSKNSNFQTVLNTSFQKSYF